MFSDWWEGVLTIGFIAWLAYEYGVGKPKRDRFKRQVAEYDAAMREGREPRQV